MTMRERTPRQMTMSFQMQRSGKIAALTPAAPTIAPSC